MKTTFILHGGETSIKNENNRKFYQSWVESFDQYFVPTVLLVYFGRKEDRDHQGYEKDTERFARYTDNRKADFIIANRDLDVFQEQLKKADVVYFRGGSSERTMNSMKPLDDDLLFLLKGKVVAGASAGVMLFSKYGRSNTTGHWREGLGLFPWVSFVHWSEEFRNTLEEFKKEHQDEDLEYILLPETEFIKKVI